MRAQRDDGHGDLVRAFSGAKNQRKRIAGRTRGAVIADLGFRHPLVRSLAWLIGSPALLAGVAAPGPDMVVDDAWCAAALDDALPWLRRQESHPAALEAFVAARKSARLGRLAETLIAYWLGHGGRFVLLAENLAVRECGRTLGEFDFVLRDLACNELVHWELTVKFYLRDPRLQGIAAFVGPTRTDTLAAKATRMFSSQLGLSRTPAGAAALAAIGAPVGAARALVKGRLFYPQQPVVHESVVNPAHARGWWMRLGEFRGAGVPAGRVFRVLERTQWLAWPERRDFAPCLDAQAIARLAEAHFRAGNPVLSVAEFDAKRAQTLECGRGMIVPDHWGRADRAAT